MSRREPVAAARRSSVRIEGRVLPLSKRATTGWVVPIFRASACCVRPARLRASITAEARANSFSRASYALRYFGSFIHFLCRSAMRAIAIPPSPNCLRACERHHPAPNTRHIERPRYAAAALQPNLPKAAFNVFHVRLAHALQIFFLDEPCNAREPCPHVFGQRLDLRIDGFVESLNRPAHTSIYQKGYNQIQEFMRSVLPVRQATRSEEHTSELQSLTNLVCRLLLEKKKS